jgi:hypothetical protein
MIRNMYLFWHDLLIMDHKQMTKKFKDRYVNFCTIIDIKLKVALMIVNSELYPGWRLIMSRTWY